MSATDRYRLVADAWLGEILERPAWAVVSPDAGVISLTELSKPGPHFATAKIGVADISGLDFLQSFGFRVVDTALVLEAKRVDASAATAIVRFARPGDRAKVEAIAGSAFRFSRFHLDPRLPKALADRIKAVWAGNWFRGMRGDGMIVCEDAAGAVVGFLLLLWEAGERLVIDLIAVEPASARRGLARAMIAFAQEHGTGDGRRPRCMVVGTQAANIPSVRLYESLGFRLREAKYVLHHHGTRA